MAMRFLNIGYGNIVSAHRIIAIVSPSQLLLNEQYRKHANIMLYLMLRMGENKGGYCYG